MTELVTVVAVTLSRTMVPRPLCLLLEAGDGGNGIAGWSMVLEAKDTRDDGVVMRFFSA